MVLAMVNTFAASLLDSTNVILDLPEEPALLHRALFWMYRLQNSGFSITALSKTPAALSCGAGERPSFAG
jgi:hypothetical protein